MIVIKTQRYNRYTKKVIFKIPFLVGKRFILREKE
jgi:hypothetical protein